MTRLNLHHNRIKTLLRSCVFIAAAFLAKDAKAQAEFTTWGNMTGIRIDNQLMEFNSSLAVENQWGDTWRTRKEGQDIDFRRDGSKKIFPYEMKDLEWTNIYRNIRKR